jgi:hypothetical protein
MRNKYAGTCYRCGENVQPGEGHFERHKGGWRTQHADCAINARSAERCSECGSTDCNGQCAGDDMMGSSG